MSWKLRVAPLIVLAPLIGVGACVSASARSKPAEPALIIPPPPPHVVPITPEPVIEPVADVPSGTTGGTTPARPGRGTRDVPAKPASNEGRADSKPGAEAVPEAPPANPPAPPSGPPPQLRTAEGPGMEGAVRATIDRARQILTTVDYRKLTTNRRKAYDDAKKFADQADEALKQGNVVFAQGVAGKAETLAKELAGR